MSAREIYSVSQLNRAVKQLLERSLPGVWLEGEVSNVSRPASGHIYFCLKDATAQVRCALFRGQARHVVHLPQNGQSVLVWAQVTLYEGRGDFQLIVEQVEEAGEGALRRAFEALKRRLSAEGLFADARKRPLPRLPGRIGVITSTSGAALHDILTTLRRRFPAVGILIH
ncbi:MAG TPA: exodeoxyribonuclease VII large subunit, partial [Acidiferrobacteraceae bacterium]|nr:exodeoxyribonuclease VII large subunit [Acidiferrobacteraceae bacterium]